MFRLTLGLLFVVLTLQATPNFVQFYDGVMNSFADSRNKSDSIFTHRKNCFNVLQNIQDELSQISQNTIQLDETLLSILGLVEKYEEDFQNGCNIAIAEASEFIQSLIENRGKFKESIEFYYPNLIRDFFLMLDYLNSEEYHLAGRFFGSLSETLQGKSTFYAKASKIDPNNRTTFNLEKFLPDFFSPLSKIFRRTTITPKKISDCLVNASSQLPAKGSNTVTILEFLRHFNDCASANQIDLGLLIQYFYQPFVEDFEESSLKFIKRLGRNVPTLDSRIKNAVTRFYEGDYSASGRDLAYIITTLF